jgi:hypothetical protein
MGIDKPGTTLDALRPELRTVTLDPGQLLRSMQPVKGTDRLSVMFGNMLRDQAEFYTPEEIDHLLDVATQAFDVVVADVGAYWDNAATLSALRHAAMRIVVTTGALSHFQEDGSRWIRQLSPVYGIPAEDYAALIIYPLWRNGGFHVKDICKELGVPFIGDLKLTESMLSQLDGGTMEEYFLRSEQGRRAMAEPAEKIVRSLGIRRRPAIVTQPWYKKLLAHRGGASG